MSYKHKVRPIILTLAAIGCLAGCNRPPGVSATAPTPESTQAYQTAFTTWSSGSQARAEQLLASDVVTYPNDQRLAFFQAACSRSRFDIAAAKPLLEKVVQLDPQSSMGQCASDILSLDQGVSTDVIINSLNALSAKTPIDPLILWLNGIECRSYNQSEDGVKIYKQLISIIPKPGPVLVHQTYANMLDETGDHKEALVHRVIAVQEEPEPWSYNGLANTLDRLGRHNDADKVRADAAVRFGQ